GYFDPTVEPGHNFLGTMMSQATRDPIFKAALTITEQDAPSSGDLCIRCHSPIGWLSGHSQPTDGSQLDEADRDGVDCDLCHRLVNPKYMSGVSPARDSLIIAGLLPAHVPTTHSNGQYVVDSEPIRRGPYGDPATPHEWVQSSFVRSAEYCGTCHEISNPVFTRVGSGADYALGPLDQAADSISSL